MSAWVFFRDTVAEFEDIPDPSEHYYKSILYLPDFHSIWMENDGTHWMPLDPEEVPSNHRLMALLLT